MSYGNGGRVQSNSVSKYTSDNKIEQPHNKEHPKYFKVNYLLKGKDSSVNGFMEGEFKLRCSVRSVH